MGMIRFRCADSLESRWKEAADRAKVDPSVIGRAVFERAFPDRAPTVSAQGEESADNAAASTREYEKRTKKVTTQFTPSEYAAIGVRAAQFGMKPYTWLVRLVRAHLTKTPQFNTDEVAALREATRELSYVGRNLNQVAHALNMNLNARDKATKELIEQVNEHVEATRARIKELLDQNLNRWGV